MKRKPMKRKPVKTWTWCLLASLCAAAAVAQPLDLETPPDSALWWTLTDEITPRELRATYRDRESHLERYQEAVEAGLMDPLSPVSQQALGFFYHRELHPELTPMWVGFAVFATRLDSKNDAEIKETMQPFGISPGGMEEILVITYQFLQEERELIAETREDAKKFGALVRKAWQAGYSEQETRAARNRNDWAFFAPYGQASEEELRRQLWAAERNPPADVSERLLPVLRQQLSSGDWEAFRTYLREYVVAGMGPVSIDFEMIRPGPSDPDLSP